MFVFSPLEQFDVIRICNISWSGYDISFVNILLPLVFFVIFIHLLLGFFLRDFKLIPDYWQISLELLFKLILDIVFQQAGSRALVFFPFIFSLFFFILFCNFMSLLPFGIALTSHIIIIFFLSCSL